LQRRKNIQRDSLAPPPCEKSAIQLSAADPPSARRSREHELSRLEQLLDDPSPGTGVIEISGDPWIGKTTLLSALGDLARDRDWTVAAGAAGPLPRGLPFGVFADALDDLLPALCDGDLADIFSARHLSWLAGIFPSLAPCAPEAELPTEPSEMFHAFHAVRALLATLSASGRLLLVIDDLHWADEASVRLFMHLVRHPPAGDVLLAAAHRPRQTDGDLRTLLGEAAADGGVAHIPLGPLDEAELNALVPDDVGPYQRRTLHRESGGNPGLLRALAAYERTVRERREERGRPGQASQTPIPMLREFRGLSPLGWEIAHAAALVQEPFDTRVLGAVAQLSEAEIWAGVDELVCYDVLSLDGTGRTFRFRNTLLRATAHQSAGAAWRLGAHARAAEVLRSRQAPPPQIARHLQHCVVAGDEDGLRVLKEAARSVLWDQPEQAALWLRTVADLAPHTTEGDGGDPELQGLLATTLARGGQLTESLALFGRALTAPPDGVHGLLPGYVQVLRLLGRHTEAASLLREALAALPPEAHRARARLTGEQLVTSLDSGSACEPLDQALLDQTGVEDDPVQWAMLRVLNTLAEADGGVSEPDIYPLQEARKRVDDLPDDILVPRLDCLYWLGRAESRLGHDEAAAGHLERALDLASRHGLQFIVPQVATMLASALLRLGDRERARALAEHAERTARSTGSDIQLAAATRLMAQVDDPQGTPPGPVPTPPDAMVERPPGSAAADRSLTAGDTSDTGGADAPAPAPVTVLTELSRREREISGLVSNGRTNQQIARALGLSHKTVETYLARIFKKLDLCSRAQLAALVGRSGGDVVAL
jgi:DNA-binding CsgD family transcriptional regulator